MPGPSPILVSLALVLLPRPSAAQDPVSWQALDFPALAERRRPPSRLERLETGRALLGERERSELRETFAPSALEPAGLIGLLLDEIGARGLKVELHSSAPPLLARGSNADLAALRAIAADLDELGRRLEVELAVWIAPGGSGLAPQDFAALSARPPDHHAVLRSGDSITFGERSVASFLTGYQVEVAHKSGIAAPLLSRALLGSVLHVRASRIHRGRALLLECWSEATALEGPPALFDPDALDLGALEQPRVRVAQVLFSDVVESGQAAALAIRGTPDGWADATLWIRAATEADPADGEPGAAWRGLDLAAFEHPTFDLPLPVPGSGLPQAADGEGPPRVLAEAFPASLLALAAESGTRSRPGPIWTEGYVLIPSSSAALPRAQEMLDALESSRSGRARLAATHGDLRVELPLANDRPARILIGRETLRLVGYRTEVAEQSWMPVPVVEPVFDGVCFQGELEGAGEEARLSGLAWVSRTEAERVLERAETGLGRLQLLSRSYESLPISIRGSTPRSATLSSGSASLTLEISAR
jgi:hypothetical protein